MKKNSLQKVTSVIALIGVLIIGSAWGYGDGQGSRAKTGNGEFQSMRGLDLTDTQKEQIKAMRVDFMKELTPMRNNMGIKMAELKAASAGDNVDTKAVNKLMDDIGAMRTAMAKKQFANKQKVRNLLSDEQKVMFDAHCAQGMRGAKQGKGMREGRKGRNGNFDKGTRGQGQGRQGRGLGNNAL